jgi:hypothetical protein
MLDPLFRDVVAVALTILLVLALVDYSQTRETRRLIIALALLAGVAVALRAIVGFPNATASFAGGVPLLVAIGVLFLSTALGISANQVFYSKTRFSWFAVLRPLCVTPIVLLPVLGSLQGLTFLQPVQLVSFALLSFQNGFFWRTVLDNAKPTKPV